VANTPPGRGQIYTLHRPGQRTSWCGRCWGLECWGQIYTLHRLALKGPATDSGLGGTGGLSGTFGAAAAILALL